MENPIRMDDLGAPHFRNPLYVVILLFYGELEVRVLPIVGSDVLVELRAEIQAPLRQCCEAPK